MEASSLLMQDAVSASEIAAAPGTRPGTLAGSVALFSNPYLDGAEEALVIDGSRQLTYLQRGATDTGWLQSPVTGGGASALKAGEVVVVIHQRDLTVWAIYTPAASGPPQALQLVATTKNGVTTCAWQAQPGAISQLTGPAITSLSHLYVYYEGRVPVVIAIDKQSGGIASIAAVTSSKSRFASVVYPGPPFLPGPFDDLAAGRVPTAFQDENVVIYVKRGADLMRYDAFTQVSGTIAENCTHIVGVYYAPTGMPGGDIGCLYLDNSGNLVAYNKLGGSFASDSTPSLGFITAATWIDVNRMTHVYGLDASSSLKVLHQAAVGVSGPPVWSRATVIDPPPHAASETVPSCVGLVPKVAAFAVDPFPDYTPNELIKREGVATPEEQFIFYSQDITSARWSREKVRLPSEGEPHLVTHYVSSVTVLDRRGVPMPGLTVQVSAESLAEIRVDGASYLVGPGHSASLPTNMLGKITIATPADGLLPATLHVDAAGLANGAVIQPASAVHDYLSGNGTLRSQAGLFDKQALENATVDGVPIVDKDHREHIDHVVNGIGQVFKQVGGETLTSRRYQGPGQAPRIHGFAVGASPDGHGGVTYREFSTAEEAEAHIAAIRALPEYGGIWDDFVAWAGDVWEGIKNGVIEVVNVVVEAVTNFFIKIGEKVVELVGFVIDTVESAIHTIEAFFSMAVDAVVKVVDWLKALFSFKDIWDAKTALQAGAETMVSYGRATINHVGRVSDRWFQDQETLVRDYFELLKARYAGRPLGDVGNQVPAITDASGHAISPADLRTDPQVNWLLDQVVGARGLASGAPAQLTMGQDSPIVTAFGNFLSGLEQSGIADEFSAILGDLEVIVAQIVDPADPDLAAKASMTALIDILERLSIAALKAMDFVVKAVVTLALTVADNIQDVLGQPLPWLGPVNDLYKWIQYKAGRTEPFEDMTLGGLFYLVAGFAVTTLNKLLNGTESAPFPDGKFPQIPAPPWSPAYHGVQDPSGDKDQNSAMMHVQQAAAGAALVGRFFDMSLDMTPVIELYGTTPETILAIGSALFTAGLFGVMSSCPPVTGNSWTEGGGGAWTTAFAIQCMWFLLCIGTIAYKFDRPFDEEATASLKNLGGTISGPVVATGFAGAYAIASWVGCGLDKVKPYVWAQVSVAAAPGAIQVIRLLVRSKTPEAVVRCVICAAVEAVALTCSYMMTIVASGEPGPVIQPFQTFIAKVNQSFTSRPIVAAGGDKVYNSPLQGWSGAYPLNHLLVDKDSGEIGGFPTMTGEYKFPVTCWDSNSPPQQSEPVNVTVIVVP